MPSSVIRSVTRKKPGRVSCRIPRIYWKRCAVRSRSRRQDAYRVLPGWFFRRIGHHRISGHPLAAAIAIAFAAGGAVSNIQTTPLLTTAQAVEALRRAGTCGYKSITSEAASGTSAGH